MTSHLRAFIEGSKARNLRDHKAFFASLGPDPLTTAERSLREINGGTMATVFAHPEDPDLVVRMAREQEDGADGWFEYAEILRQAYGGRPPAHGPALLDLAVIGDVWVGICPRLRPVKTADEVLLMQTARRVLAPDWEDGVSDTPDPEDLAFLSTRQPLFLDFAEAHLGHYIDFGNDNFMMDGDRLIVNDPLLFMDETVQWALGEKYAFTSPVDAPEDCAV